MITDIIFIISNSDLTVLQLVWELYWELPWEHTWELSCKLFENGFEG